MAEYKTQEDIIELLIQNLPSFDKIKEYNIKSYKLSNRNKFPLLETSDLQSISKSMNTLYSFINSFYLKSQKSVSSLSNVCAVISKINQLSNSRKSIDSNDVIANLLEKHSTLKKLGNIGAIEAELENSAKHIAALVKDHIAIYNHVKNDYKRIYEIYNYLKISIPNKASSIENNRILTAFLNESLSIVPSLGSDTTRIDKFKISLNELSDDLLHNIAINPDIIISMYIQLATDYDGIFQKFMKESIFPFISRIGGIFEYIGTSETDLYLILNSGGISSIAKELAIIDFSKLNEESSDAVLSEYELSQISKKKNILSIFYKMLNPELHENSSDIDSDINELIALVGKINTEKDEIDPENYFYVGSTGDVGALELVRENAPNVKIDDIIGESFDDMKSHLMDLTQYSEHSNLYAITSPRKKIKSNMIAIGPYGCGKTEIARAIAADERFVGIEISVSDLLTAYFGEFEKNVDRLWEQASQIRKETGKMVFIIMDEFDSFFGGKGQFQSNHSRVQKIIQAKLDGVTDYEGIIVIGMTNEPKEIPLAILRRFKYVDVVGQLTNTERIFLLKKFITRGIPLDNSFKNEDWEKWGTMLDGSTGDILGKIADDIHYEYMTQLIKENPTKSKSFEELATSVRLEKTSLDKLKKEISKYKNINRDWVNDVIESKLKEPVIQEQIKLAVNLYKDADSLLNNMHKKDSAVI